MTTLIIKSIGAYKRFIRPAFQLRLMGFFVYSDCMFQPSCSDYALSAVSKHGPSKGLIKSIWRIMRCNPWSAGGIDEP